MHSDITAPSHFVIPDHAYLTSRRKRALDIIGALLLIAVLSPVIVGTFLCLLVTGGRPVYGQPRVGRKGKVFRCWKFRSMVVHADRALARILATDAQRASEWKATHKLKDDPRVTRVGRFIRRTSIDELPQLFNVLMGDMSLVGPRPVTQPELNRYGSAVTHYLAAPPGVTGLWQVSGRSNTSYDYRVSRDVAYYEMASLRADLGILMRTVSVVVRGSGAC